ncbi:Alcohol dehydrogenase (quinone), cytochrome c subunit [Paraburkholderia kururiensis]
MQDVVERARNHNPGNPGEGTRRHAGGGGTCGVRQRSRGGCSSKGVGLLCVTVDARGHSGSAMALAAAVVAIGFTTTVAPHADAAQNTSTHASAVPAAISTASTASTAAPATASLPARTPADDANTRLIARGAYLAKAADCAGCHTAPPGKAPAQHGHAPAQPIPFAGGLGMASPFGTIYSSNITPDPNAGIGRYTYDDFVRAVREGVAPGGKRLYPAMPFPSFSGINDEDMHALYAYFMHGVQPVSLPAPATRLPFPFNQRWALGLWSWAFAPRSRFAPQPQRDALVNRGAYLVQTLGHCGACHTPRGPAYEERGYNEGDPLYLTGGTNDHWFAPNLTGDPGSGLGRVSREQIAAFLKTGHGGGLSPFGSMVQVVEDSMQYLDDEDLDAIAAYLKSLPARQSYGRYSPQSIAAQQSVRALKTGEIERPGAGLYQSYCARCHQADGMGVANKYPRLAGNPVVLSPHVTSLVRLLVEGGRSPDTQEGPQPHRMPSFAGHLTSTEMARVLTFVRTAWGNDAAPVTPHDVRAVRAAIHK